VVGEIRAVWDEFGPFGSIYFDDDTFNIGRGRMLEFAAAMKSLPFRIPWGCNARPELFDKDVLARLAETGLFCIRIGIESGDPEILHRAKKDLDLAAVRRTIDLARQSGVAVHASYTIGLAGESWESVKRTAAFARSISPNSVAFTITTPYPGTSYHDEVVRNDFLRTREWDHYNGVSGAVHRTEKLSSEEIARAYRYMMRKVYYSPSYVYKRFRYAANVKEIARLARKGIRLFLHR
jgi:anaerobic magnesium-protoporphyrin IX monomethyl ester cyclase